MNFRNRVLASVGAVAILASTALTGAAQTAVDTKTASADVEITRSDENNYLSVAIIGADFEAVPYSFVNQTIPNKTVSVVVTDTRGEGLGWNVTLSASDFKTVDNSRSFGSNNLALDPSGPATGLTIGGYQSNVAGLDYGMPFNAGSATKIISAPANVNGAPSLIGAGQFQLDMDADLIIPGGTLVGDYASTLTVNIASGPGN